MHVVAGLGAVGVGWKLMGLSCIVLLVSLLGAYAFNAAESPRLRAVRRACLMAAAVAAITLIVIVIVGPGDWCGPGSAYEVPGCA